MAAEGMTPAAKPGVVSSVVWAVHVGSNACIRGRFSAAVLVEALNAARGSTDVISVSRLHATNGGLFLRNSPQAKR
jgi:hypothetical protein